MHLCVGIGDVAGDLVLNGVVCVVAECFRRRLPGLLFSLGVVNAASVYARRGSCFHPAGQKPVLSELLGNAICSALS